MSITSKKEIKDIFKEVVSNLSGYEFRQQQLTMAETISNTFEQIDSIIIEAGTGSGKSFGYLVPAAISGQKIVISTGTIALQEQLMNKDIPFIVEHCNKDLKYALAKGRGNYLCKQKFFDSLRTLSSMSKELRTIKKLEQALLEDWTGDVAELDFSVPGLVWQEVNSDKDDCLSHRCEYFSKCSFRLARAVLGEVDIIISNHSLYFTDLASGGTILPKHDFVIFDEAHHIRSTATKAFTVNIGKWASTRLMQKIQRRIAPVPDDININLAGIETKILSWLMAKGKDNFRIFPDSDFYSLVSHETSQLQSLRTWLSDLDIKQMDLFQDENFNKKITHKDRLLSQASNLISRWEYFMEQDLLEEEDLRVNWTEVNRNKLSFEINSAPIFISKILKDKLWNNMPAVLTSATLAVNRSCEYTKKQLGITAKELILDSPFNFSEQASLYLPKSFIDPNSKDYNPHISRSIKEIIEITEGRCLVLFTSINSMNNVSAYVMEQIEYPCKVQGDLPRSKLIDWFKETDNSVLFATATFWEGIDIPGEDLSCVIIDKIPFINPDDPVVSATVDEMKAKNQSWFMDYMLPEAALKLKQGFGRLIRTKTDKGIICLLDPRLLGKAYGQIIINSLPRAPIINSILEVKEFFEQLKY